MTPLLTFFFGLLLLGLFAWYFSTESDERKRWLGLVLTVLVVFFCIDAATPPQKKISLGLDLRGGTSFLLQLVPQNGEEITADMLQQAVEVIRKRVDKFGVSEPVIAPQGTSRILVQIPGLDPAQIQSTKEQLQQVAKLEFAEVYRDSATLIPQIEKGEAIIPPGYEIKETTVSRDGTERSEKLLVRKTADLTGDHVTHAYAFFDNKGYAVGLSLDGEGARRFFDLTTSLAPYHGRLAILLDGKVQSAPQVNEPIPDGRATISGNFKEKEVRDLASILENPLRTPVQILETRSVSPSLGADSIRSGIDSCLWGLALVTVFMVVYYRFVGLIAIVALLVNCVMIIGALGMFHSVLTLPGIAGLILSLGIALDANVLIYERLREELAAGKPLKAAVKASYDKAFSAIFDAHVTQFLTAAILYWLASGPVKGFALTLTIGIVASMFSSLLVTYTCFRWAFEWNVLGRVSMLHLIRSKGFNFLGHAKPFVFCSAVLVIVSIGVFASRGNRNFDADFKGGDLIVFSSVQGIVPDQVRGILADAGVKNSTVQAEHVASQDLISIRADYGSADRIEEVLKGSFQQGSLTFEKTEHIGPLVGKELAKKSGLALALGLLGIFVYVSLRFEASFAFGSLIALAHDLIITIGVFALSGRELSLIMVAAILTIAGYSINDKIVVFDRIRSGLRHRSGGSISKVMNDSINETLSRTVLTGGTVLLTVLALYFFGGPVLNDFAFAFVVGVIVGTYSSVFVASPIVFWCSRWGAGRAARMAAKGS